MSGPVFEQHEINGYLSRMIEVRKSIYDAIEFDSDLERQFALTLDARDDIKMFVKLPNWFVVETPLGKYNPDWAIVKQNDCKLYLIRETKATTDQMLLRGSEWAKIECGKAHFDELGVDFRHISSADQL